MSSATVAPSTSADDGSHPSVSAPPPVVVLEISSDEDDGEIPNFPIEKRQKLDQAIAKIVSRCGKPSIPTGTYPANATAVVSQTTVPRRQHLPKIIRKRIKIEEDGQDEDDDPEMDRVKSALTAMIGIRKKYLLRSLQAFPAELCKYSGGTPPVYSYQSLPKADGKQKSPGSLGFRIQSLKGVVQVISANGELMPDLCDSYTSIQDFKDDYKTVKKCIYNGKMRSFCEKRLFWLKQQFKFHQRFNQAAELAEQKMIKRKDFSNVYKVDNHIHGGASMTREHLLSFMKRKHKSDGKKNVLKCGDPWVTLEQVFRKLNIDPDDLTLDTLDVNSDSNLFHRFDLFNQKYNPCGRSDLRQIFLKWDNNFGGEFYAELLKEVIKNYADDIYAEIRLSIHGLDGGEWDRLATWFVKNGMETPKVRWVVQLPRLFDVYREKGLVQTFQQMVDNIYLPLFESTNCPKSHPELHQFLQSVVAFDSVDDEFKDEPDFDKATSTADMWAGDENPPYQLYIYYMYANLAVLNKFRSVRKFNIFALRPHAGEAPGSAGHLISTFMCALSINHGIELRSMPVARYLYYLCGIGLSVSPTSNHRLFTTLDENPFRKFFDCGLNIAVSTDDPLIFGRMKEPLLAEYCLVGEFFKLIEVDKCELAKNSVQQSGFSTEDKRNWIGEGHNGEGDDQKTNVPKIRTDFRMDVWKGEMDYIYS